MRKLAVWCLSAAALVALSGPAMAADAEKGNAAFTAKCALCHQIGPNAQNLVGPQLNGVAGRKAAGRAWQLLRGAGAPDLGTEKNPAALLENGGPGAVDGTSTRARRCWTTLTANRPAARGRADDRRA